MVNTVNPKCIPVGSDLLGQVDYYGAVLGRKDLISRKGDFRNSKLGLIIDLIKTVEAPDELKTKLTSAIIDAWRMDAPDNPLEERTEEMGYIMRSIESIRRTVQWSKRHPGSETGRMLDIAVLFAVPLMPSDLNPKEVRPIHDLLGQLVDHLSKPDKDIL